MHGAFRYIPAVGSSKLQRTSRLASNARSCSGRCWATQRGPTSTRIWRERLIVATRAAVPPLSMRRPV